MLDCDLKIFEYDSNQNLYFYLTFFSYFCLYIFADTIIKIYQSISPCRNVSAAPTGLTHYFTTHNNQVQCCHRHIIAGFSVISVAGYLASILYLNEFRIVPLTYARKKLVYADFSWAFIFTNAIFYNTIQYWNDMCWAPYAEESNCIWLVILGRFWPLRLSLRKRHHHSASGDGLRLMVRLLLLIRGFHIRLICDFLCPQVSILTGSAAFCK